MKNSDHNISAIGLMSGTSCDGLDIAYCQFTLQSGKWTYAIVAADTIAYDEAFLAKLQAAPNMTGLALMNFDREFGTFCGKAVTAFLQQHKLPVPQVIGSHGHTIFHTPTSGLTYQLGSGASLYAACNIPVACDFRSIDVALGGQGAPLVPMGDRLLFSAYDYCLNLGGISNISFTKEDHTIAFDICPVNMALNYLANEAGMAYDEGGQLAASGQVDPTLLAAMHQLDFYRQAAPKSLGKEWFDLHFLPLLQNNASLGIASLMATCVEHMAEEMALIIKNNSTKTKQEQLLATGGGAFNTHLMDVFTEKLKDVCDVVVVDQKTIAFKEALIFALLGVLRCYGKNNVLSSATGSERDHCGGAIYGVTL